jgi:hypothetical protein
MMNKPIEYYLSLPELAAEHPILRQIHASRLKIHEDEQGMTREERRAYAEAAVSEFMGDTPIRWAPRQPLGTPLTIGHPDNF